MRIFLLTERSDRIGMANNGVDVWYIILSSLFEQNIIERQNK